jgi:amino acid adenylation domain-containing protein
LSTGQSLRGRTLRSAWQTHLENAGFGDDEDFFELGGDSLAVLRIVSTLAAAGYPLSLTDFYANPTVRDQLALLAADPADTADPPDAAPAPGPAAPARRLPLAPLQPVLLLDSLSNPGSDAYWMVNAYRLAAPVTAAQARTAWAAMVAANPALQARFALDGSGAAQIIDPAGGPELCCLDSVHLDPDRFAPEPGDPGPADSVPYAADPDPALAGWCRGRVAELYRSGVDVPAAGWFVQDWRAAPDADPAPLLLFAVHHALMDGWSLAQCLADFVGALAAALGAPTAGPAPRPSVAAYFTWREKHGALAAATAFWRGRLAGLAPAETPGFALAGRDEAGPAGVAAGRRAGLELAPADSARLAGYCARHAVTQAALIACLWSRVLARYQQSPDLCVGLTVNIRPAGLPDALRLSGCLINVVPLRLAATGRPLPAAARDAMEAVAAASEHGHLSYPELCQAAGLAPDTRLFASTVVFQNFAGDVAAAGAAPGGGPLARAVYGSAGSADPLCLTVDVGECTRLLVEWDESRYDGRTVRQLLRALAYFAARPEEAERRAASGGWLTDEEHADAVLGAAAAPRPWAVAGLLRPGAGDAVAVACDDEVWTHADLREQAAAMAGHLRGLGLRPGARVAFLGQRGPAAAAALCGAWLAGLTWCAVDAGLPDQRRARLLAAFRPDRMVDLDQDPWRVPSGPPAAADDTAAHPCAVLPPDTPAYLVSTSGSSGEPKAVALPAGGLAPLVDAWHTAYPAGPDGHRVLQLGSWTADVFLGDLLKALSTGGRLVVCPDERRVDLDHLADLIGRHRITLLESTPVLVRALLRRLAERGERPESLRTLIVGSDAFRAEELAELRGLLWPGLRLVNGYGLSECTIESLVYDCAADGRAGAARSRSGLPPVGAPLPGTAVEIVDPAGRRLPRGAVGELRITGPGVGLGYLADGGLQPDGRFEQTADGRAYRTGDFGSIDPDGTVQFFGRRDAQVKIRGHRIETGEVENALLGLAGVDEVWVRAAGPAGRVRLHAHVGSASGADPDRLRGGLRELLPEYAVPDTFDVLARLPRTGNGKVDRTALAARPAPAARPRPAPADESPLAAEIRGVWEDLLGHPVDPDRSFFDSGGHSILVIALFERLRSRFGRFEFTVADLFRHPTVRRFARHLDAPAGPADRMAVLRAVERGELSPAEGLRRVRELSR